MFTFIRNAIDYVVAKVKAAYQTVVNFFFAKEEKKETSDEEKAAKQKATEEAIAKAVNDAEVSGLATTEADKAIVALCVEATQVVNVADFKDIEALIEASIEAVKAANLDIAKEDLATEETFKRFSRWEKLNGNETPSLSWIVSNQLAWAKQYHGTKKVNPELAEKIEAEYKKLRTAAKGGMK